MRVFNSKQRGTIGRQPDKPVPDGVDYNILGRHGDGWQVFDADGKSVTQSYGRQANDEHIANFIDCIRSRQLPNGDVEGLHLSTLLCHDGNISDRLGRKLKIDPQSEGFIGDAEANRLVKRQYRPPWMVPENV